MNAEILLRASDMRTWIVKIGASRKGSVGGLYYAKRIYEIETDNEESVNDLAIRRGHDDGLEHVLVESKRLKEPEQRNGYVTTRDTGYRKEYDFDMRKFAADLAAGFGDSAQMRERGESYDRIASIVFNDDTELSLYWQEYGKTAEAGKVSMSLRPTGISYELMPSHGDKYKLPSIVVSSSRPIKTLVADIRRRLFTQAASPIAAIREYAASQQQYRNNLRATAETIKRDFPSFRVDARETEAAFSQYGINPHMSGRIYADGTVSIERLSGITQEQLAAICNILYGVGK